MKDANQKEAWCVELGLLPYEEGLKLQERLVAKRSQGTIRDTLLLLEHPPIFTANPKKGFKNVLISPDDLEKEGISICETNRGGDVTYHGPGQLVGYLIMDLKGQEATVQNFVYKIEDLLIRLLNDYSISAGRNIQYPGVWVKNEKIAAIGIAVKTGLIAMHGFALNVNPNLDHFSFIIPCGIKNKGVTSMDRILGKKIDQEKLHQRLKSQFETVFNMKVRTILLEQIP